MMMVKAKDVHTNKEFHMVGLHGIPRSGDTIYCDSENGRKGYRVVRIIWYSFAVELGSELVSDVEADEPLLEVEKLVFFKGK